MRIFLLKKINVLTEKEVLLLKAGKVFSRAADDLVTKKQDESYAWKALGAFCETLSAVNSQSELKDVDSILKNEKSLYTYMDFIKQREKKAFESEMRSFKQDMKEEISVIKNQNTRLDDQNIQLLDRNEVLEKQGVRSTRLALTLFALSVLVSAAPFVAKKLGYDIEPPAKPVTTSKQEAVLQNRPKLEVYNNYYFINPIASGDGKKKDLPPANDQDNVPVLMPRGKKVRPSGFTPK